MKTYYLDQSFKKKSPLLSMKNPNFFTTQNKSNFMQMLKPISFAIAIFLSSCTPFRMAENKFDKDVKTSKIQVRRESKVLFIGVPAIFGYDEQDKAKLWNADKSELEVPTGKHEFFVRSNQADRPFKINAEIIDGKTTCFVINPEPKPLLKFVIPPLYWLSSAFKLEEDGVCNGNKIVE